MTKLHKLTYFLAFITLIYAAVKSSGYYHEDEHYQIVGFAEFRSGNTNEVAWEYAQRMRPTLQPAITMLIFWVLRQIGIHSPFMLTLFLRIITALVSFFVIKNAVRVFSRRLHQRYHLIFLFTSYFLWFLPLLNVRFSAESSSGLCLLMSSILILSANAKNKQVWLGICLALSVLFRFQSIIFVFFILSWYLLVRKGSLKSLLPAAVCFCVVIFLGVLADSIFYGEFVFAIVNFVQLNVLEGVSGYYGVEPWYELLLYVLGGPGFIIGSIILIGLARMCYTKSKNLFCWIIVPYLLIHMVIPHKEIRFLFPLINFVPIVLMLSIEEFGAILRGKSRCLKIVTMAVLALFNFVCLFTVLNSSMRRGENEVAAYLYSNFKTKCVLLTTTDANPYDPSLRFRSNFYKRPNMNIEIINSFWSIDWAHRKNYDVPGLLLLSESEITGQLMTKRLKDAGIKLVMSTENVLDSLTAKWKPYLFYLPSPQKDFLLLYRIN